MISPYAAAERMLQGAPLPPGKLRESVRGRTRSAARWEDWAAKGLVGRPLAWFHAASVGEALAVQPVIHRLRRHRANLAVVLTHTSPSVADWPDTFDADAIGFAPSERTPDLERVFDALAPTLLACSRGDLWPGMVGTALERGVPVGVVGGMIGAGSARLRWPARKALHKLCCRLSYVGAVDTTDADRWRALGTPRNVISVTGDPRHDQILDRIPRLDLTAPVRLWILQRGGGLLVAGSSHREDAAITLDACRAMSTSQLHHGALIVPHEPRDSTTRWLLDYAARQGIRASVWGDAPIDPAAQLVVVTRTGVLADLYALAAIALVGGGFHRTGGGLHSLAEPAAYAVPTAAGPRGHDAPEARPFAKATVVLPLERREAARRLAACWTAAIKRDSALIDAGLAARGALEGGAAMTSVQALLQLIGQQDAGAVNEPLKDSD
jgi:3-deoxy-D-manno-octulosonic-acid transferase